MISHNMEQPKVSIIVPCYNSEAFLAETLQSCINQLYPNIEVVVVDDGSTDGSLQIARQWEARYTNIHVYAQPNSGACRARNLAMEKCTGDYVMYLDADDIISVEKISSQMELLAGEPISTIATCAWDRFFNSLEDATFPRLMVYKDYETTIELIEDLLNGGMFGVSCYLVHRDILKQAGSWNEDLTINTDGEYFIRVLLCAQKVKYSSIGKLFYRSNMPNSMSRRKASEQKGKLLLHSYVLIQNHLAAHDMLSIRNKLGLVREFQSTAYQYSKYAEIVSKAHTNAKQLNKGNICPVVGGKLFRLLCMMFGFWNVLRLKNLLK